MELSEHWVAVTADDELRRTFAEPDLDTTRWEPVQVPGHWQQHAAFGDDAGPLLYRTRFETPAGADDDRRWWLRFDGMFSQGDVWLDGAYLGDTEGAFHPHVFEITDAVAARSEHVLGVEVACPPVRDRTNKRLVTGTVQDHPGMAEHWTPGGLWQPVHVVDTGPVRIARLDTRCVEASDERAVLAFRAELDAGAAPADEGGIEVRVRTTVGPVDHGHDHTLAAGSNIVEWTVTIERPRLWWPHALGDATLHDVTVDVLVDDRRAGNDHVSDRRTFRTGLRQIELRRWAFHVNGERLFTKGTALLPRRWALAGIDPQEARDDVTAARDAGFDLVRMLAHVGHAATYDAADELGMLVWQDVPLTGAYNRQIRKQAVREAQAMVSTLGHRPSVALWCGHDRPVDDASDTTLWRRIAHHQQPSWNRTVLDRAVRRALASADDSRPVITHSGVLPHLGDLTPPAAALSLGWDHGDVRDLGGLARAVPNLVRFPTGLGAEAVAADRLDHERTAGWPCADADVWAAAGHDLERLQAHTPIDGQDPATWASATRAHQAEVLRRSIQTLRRLKYRPTGGFIQRHFADPDPGGDGGRGDGRGLLDGRRRPSPALAAVTEACAPVIVVADRLPATVAEGDALALDIHVVSDRRVPVDGTVDVWLRWTDVDGGAASHRWRFRGTVDADSVARIGTIQFVIEPGIGAVTIDAVGDFGADQARYDDQAGRA